jgi:hypothetical protein
MGSPESTQAIRYRVLRVDAAGPQDSSKRRVLLEAPAPCHLEIGVFESSSPPEPRFTEKEAVLEAWQIPPGLKDSPAWREALKRWIGAASDRVGVPPFTVRTGEMQVQWLPGYAVWTAPEAQAKQAWEALLDFACLEEELRRMEAGIGAAWTGLEQDMPLAYDVHKRDLERDPEIANRARTALLWRMTLARLEPLLCGAPARFSPPVAQLAEALREAARCEDRLQYADSQIEVHESVYEMAGQRLGEFRNTRSTFITEAVIIALLAAEVLLMLWDLLKK